MSSYDEDVARTENPIDVVLTVKKLVVAKFVCCLLFCLTADNASLANDLLLKNVRVLDVESGEVSKESDVRISGNEILEIGTSLSPKENEDSLDLAGKFILPGLMDLHSHLLLHPYDEASWNDQVLKESLGLRTIRGTIHARKTLEAGFTTIRELGTEGAGFADVAIRDAINNGMIPGPRVLTATRALVTSGGYGPSGFDPRFIIPKGAQQADGVGEVRRATREQIAAGADWIKVYADYRRQSGGGSTPTFSKEELNAIVDEANSAGLKVSAHATTEEGIIRAVKAGVATTEHGYQASPEALKMMKDAGVVLCPTLAASHSMAIYSGWDPKTADHSRVATAKELMKNALRSGVTIACGSDVGVFSHGDNARELELMFAYGMPIKDVLRSATSIAAKTIGRAEDLGQVKAGFIADLIVVEQNPLDKLETLRKPFVVIQAGKVVFEQE